ncbi:uncharacterized protein LALA0_S08e00518g [Lachancea lanzarotensis]|uniref:LALA0S08e00518g1_1 n=1 Tax=Lachancea lanzarotensis TaxID=1245769 RepID=A0A0C7N5Y5_9SACH|nr:uncharacterized protein LALA0_S08e00518g [Lachancea lanzarotensis]CEP63355.1 LALA0S08e00518g1_1 [Lachancea lanzarotensis]
MHFLRNAALGMAMAAQSLALVSNSSSSSSGVVGNYIVSTTTGSTTSFGDMYVFLHTTELQVSAPVDGITFELDRRLGGLPGADENGDSVFKFDYGTAELNSGNITVNFTSVPPSGRYNLTFPTFIGQDQNQIRGESIYTTLYENQEFNSTIDYVPLPSDRAVFNSIEYDSQNQAYFYLNIPKEAYLGGFTFNTTGPKSYSYIAYSFDFGFTRTPDDSGATSDSFDDPASTDSTNDSVYPQDYELDTSSGGINFVYNGNISTATTSMAGDDTISYIGTYIKFEVTPPTGTNVFELDATLSFNGDQKLTYSFHNYGHGPGFLNAYEIPAVTVGAGSASSPSSAGSSSASSAAASSGSASAVASSSAASSGFNSSSGASFPASSGSSVLFPSASSNGSMVYPGSSASSGSASGSGFASSSVFGSSSSAVAGSKNISAGASTTTTQKLSTTVITTCPICTGKDKTTAVGVSTVTTTIGGVMTEYTTYCPLTAQTASLSVSSGATVSASVAISEVSSGVYTVYTTYCPYTSSSGAATVGAASSASSYSSSTTALLSQYEAGARSLTFSLGALLLSMLALI